MFQTAVGYQIKTLWIFSNIFFCRNTCRLWNNMEQYCRAGQATNDNTIRRMRIACWVPKATNTHSECTIIIAFPSQQWFHKRAWMLRYSACRCISETQCAYCAVRTESLNTVQVSGKSCDRPFQRRFSWLFLFSSKCWDGSIESKLLLLTVSEAPPPI
jgi:hypothetical protein